MMTAFEQHLDLSRLKGRRTGLVRCPFHNDSRASLSVDLDRHIFHCFGCGVHGGHRAFMDELLRRGVVLALEIGQRQPWAQEPARTLAELQDWIRNTRREIAAIRASATDDERGWALLSAAADLERAASAAEQEVDEAMGW